MRSKRTCPACPRGCPSAPSPPPARAGGLEATYPPPHRHQHHFLCFPPHRFPRPHCEGKSCRSSSPSRLHRHLVHLKSQNYSVSLYFVFELKLFPTWWQPHPIVESHNCVRWQVDLRKVKNASHFVVILIVLIQVRER